MSLPRTQVLLIEDHDPDAENIHRLLSGVPAESFAIRRAHTLAEGLTCLDDRPLPNIVLLDLTLPDSHRSVSASSVLNHSPSVPVIVLTGYADEQAALEIVQQGVMDFLVKDDLNRHLLTRSIRYAIERLRILEELRIVNRRLAHANTELEERVEERTLRIQEMEEVARQQQHELAHVARLDLLGELSTGLAHELNQPLMAIAAFSKSAKQRLKRGDDNAQIPPLLEDIASEAIRAGEIIQRLRSMSQRREPQQADVEVQKLIQDTLLLLRHEIRSRNIDVKCGLSDVDVVVRTDSIQLQQVLMNLIQNAIREVSSDDKGERVVGVTLTTTPSEIEIQIRNFLKSPPDNVQSWFDTFYTSNPQGLGMGLPISKRIMETLRGDLTAAVDGTFVTMTMRLPRKRTET